MCGIAGIIMHDPAAEVVKTAELLYHIHKMTDVLIHRGPDGDGFWTNGNGTVGFGHRRLSIIDLSTAAAQPMHYLDRYTIVYNGEIYNYIELTEELHKKGYSFRTNSDTEVILAAYDCWKEECLQYFDGMFSFAIWDEKEQTLFAARDRFGEKPFYYYNDADQLIFASEMKALWAVGVPKRVDEKMLLNFITIGHLQNVVHKEQTFFEDIFSLPPSHYLLLSKPGNTLSIKKYWDLDKETRIDISTSDAIERFTSLFSTSVKRRLRSDVPVGTSLSGGLDSTAIVSMISGLKNNSKKIPAFSAVFPGFERDESKYIRSAVEAFDITNFQVQPTAAGLIDEFEKLCYHQEEPFSSSSIYAQYKVYELAAKNKVTVLLDGQGADETLAGYYKYCHWYLQQLVSRGKFTAMGKEKKALLDNNIPVKWGFKNYLASYFPPHTAVQLERKEYNKIINHPDVHKDFLLAVRGREWEGIRKPIITKLNDILYFNTAGAGLEELLRFADRNSMAHSTEVRLPFLSHDLVQFLFSLPANFKIHEGWTKWLLRKSMDKKIPAEITWRRDKVGYETPQQQWMTDTTLSEYMHEAKRKLVNHHILKQQVLNKSIAPQSAHEANNYDWRYLCAAQLL